MAEAYEKEKLHDINKKISLIQTIINRCSHLVSVPVKLGSPIGMTMFFTNESNKNIEEARKNPKARPLKQLLDINEHLQTKIKGASILSCQIFSFLYEYYVNKRMLLDLQTIYKELKNDNIVENQKEILKDRGFIWRELSGNKCTLIEDPEVQAKRIKYLLDMKRFREENRIFVYVEEKEIPADASTLVKFQMCHQFPDTGTFRYVKIAVSPQLGVLSLSMHNPGESVAEWLSKEVAKHLRPSFVLVFHEDMIKEDPIETAPAPGATKIEMIKWLELHDIPHTTTMHRADLYELIDLYKEKVNDKKNMLDVMFQNKGIEILKRPKGWPELNYFEFIWYMDALWQDVTDGPVGTAVERRLQMAVNLCSTASWQNYHTELQKRELERFEKDMELEEVVDKLIAFTNDMPMVYTNLPNIWEVKENEAEICAKNFSGTL